MRDHILQHSAGQDPVPPVLNVGPEISLPGSFQVSTLLMQDAVPAETISVRNGRNQVALFANPLLQYREEALVIDLDGHLTYLRRKASSETGWDQETVRSKSGDVVAATEVVVIVHWADLSVWAIAADTSNQLKTFRLTVRESAEGGYHWQWQDPILWNPDLPLVNTPRHLSVYYDGIYPYVFGIDSLIGSPFLVWGRYPTEPQSQSSQPFLYGTSTYTQIDLNQLPIDQFVGAYKVGGNTNPSVFFLSGDTLYQTSPRLTGPITRDVTKITDKVSEIVGLYDNLFNVAPFYGCIYRKTDGVLWMSHWWGSLRHQSINSTDFQKNLSLWRDAEGFNHIYGLGLPSEGLTSYTLKVLHQVGWGYEGFPVWAHTTPATTVDLTAKPNPARVSDTVTLTAKATGFPSGPLKGTMTFKDGERSLTPLVPVDASGTATLTIPTWLQNDDWNANYFPQRGGLFKIVVDTNELICPPGRIVTGIAFWEKDNKPDENGNRLTLRLQHANPDGSDPQWLQNNELNDQHFPMTTYADTNELICPPGRIVTGVQFWQKSTNRLALRLQHAHPDGSDPQWLQNNDLNGNIIPGSGGLGGFYADSNSLTCSAGMQLRGIALRQKGGNRLAPRELASWETPDTHPLTATYSGDSDHAPGTSPITNLVVVDSPGDITEVVPTQPQALPTLPVTLGLYANVMSFALDAHPDYRPSELVRFYVTYPAERFCIATQDISSSLWAVDQIRIPPQEKPTLRIVNRYIANVTLLSVQGTPMAGHTVSISADTMVHVEINGSSYIVGPGKSMKVTTSDLGKVTVAVNADGLVPPIVQLGAEGLPTGTAIDFAAVVNSFLAGKGTLPSQSGLLTAERLKNAQTISNDDGKPTKLVTTWPSNMGPQDMVDHCANMYRMAAGDEPLKLRVEGLVEPQEVAGYVIQTWDSTRPGYQVFRTGEELQAHSASLLVHPSYGGIWEDFLSWADDVWEGIKSGASNIGQVLVDLKNSTVELFIKLGNAIVSLGKMIIETIEQAARAVESFFQMVAQAASRVIDWLKSLFAFKDIWETRLAIESGIQTIQSYFTSTISYYSGLGERWFEEQKAKLPGLFNDLKARYQHTRLGDVQNQLPQPINSSGEPLDQKNMAGNPQANWLLNQTMSELTRNPAAFALAFSASSPILDAYNEFIQAIANSGIINSLTTAIMDIGNLLVGLFDFNDPAGAARTSLVKFFDVVETLAVQLLDDLKKIFQAAIKFATSVATNLSEFFNYKPPLGFINDLYKWVQTSNGIKDPEDMTVIGLFSLISAFIGTTLYKLVMGVESAPFPGGVFPTIPAPPWHPAYDPAAQTTNDPAKQNRDIIITQMAFALATGIGGTACGFLTDINHKSGKVANLLNAFFLLTGNVVLGCPGIAGTSWVEWSGIWLLWMIYFFASVGSALDPNESEAFKNAGDLTTGPVSTGLIGLSIMGLSLFVGIEEKINWVSMLQSVTNPMPCVMQFLRYIGMRASKGVEAELDKWLVAVAAFNGVFNVITYGITFFGAGFELQGPPQITPGQKPTDGQVGQTYPVYTLTVYQLHPSPLNTPITNWVCLDLTKMPPGLKLDKQSGIIYGEPTQAGTFTFTVQCTDSYGPPMYSEPAEVTMTIKPSS